MGATTDQKYKPSKHFLLHSSIHCTCIWSNTQSYGLCTICSPWQQLKLSDGCRSRVLNSDVTKFDIFEEARLEILNVLKVRCPPDRSGLKFLKSLVFEAPIKNRGIRSWYGWVLARKISHQYWNWQDTCSGSRIVYFSSTSM